jgi:hypothetical protein
MQMPTGPYNRRVLFGVIALLVVVAVARVATSGAADDLDGAIGIASTASRFESSQRAADSFVKIRGILLDEARSCVAKHSAQHPPCAARGAAVALAQSAAVVAVQCTQPGVYEARAGILRYLQGIKRLDRAPAGPPPPFPTLPHCS